jgi:hypothetical protein
VAYVHNSDGVFRSLDGGATWKPFSEGFTANVLITTLVFQPSRPGTILAGASASGVWSLSLPPDGGRINIPMITR